MVSPSSPCTLGTGSSPRSHAEVNMFPNLVGFSVSDMHVFLSLSYVIFLVGGFLFSYLCCNPFLDFRGNIRDQPSFEQYPGFTDGCKE